tara:strand:- start:879 stop:1259 length:381 start_codon:yes stop_codon:yes gene_type:complete
MKLGDYLKTINYTKENLMLVDPLSESKYPPFIVNKSLSYFTDTVLYANEMNRHAHLDNRLQYDYYVHAVRKRKRFSRWDKNEKSDKFDLLKEYYGYSDRKINEVMDLISDEELDTIKELVDTGEKK